MWRAWAGVGRPGPLFEADFLFLYDLEGLVGLDHARDAPELAHALDLGIKEIVRTGKIAMMRAPKK